MSSSGSANDPKLALLAAALRQGGDRVIRKAREAMKREADKIVVLAKSNAPVLTVGKERLKSWSGEEGNLEASIKRVDTYDEEQNGRLQIDVIAGGEVDGVDVDKYVLIMNEGLSPYGSGAAGKLGPASQDKAAAGHDVGGRFMDRALEARQDAIPDAIMTAIESEVEGIVP